MSIRADCARAFLALYATGNMGYRTAARIVGISPRSAARILGRQGRHVAIEQVEADPDPDYLGKPVRCPVCGFVRPAPCAVCAAREYEGAGLSADEGEPDFALELRPAERRRYEELLRQRAVDEIMADLADAREALDEAAADAYFAELGRDDDCAV